MSKRSNIILVGFMGTGKSVVGKRLAQRLGWRFVDTDKLVEARAGCSIADLFEQSGEAAFRKLEHELLEAVVEQREQVIATGGGAYVDAANRKLLDRSGIVVCLTARPEIVYERVKRRLAMRPKLSESVDPETRIRELLRQRTEFYAKAQICVDASELSVDEEVRRVWQAVQPYVEAYWDEAKKSKP